MEIRQLECFIQVCKDRSFSKAAENLHISQQGLSKTMKKLEDELEDKLFFRSSKGVQPTKLGDLLLEKSQSIIEEFNAMVEFIYDEAKLKKGTVTVGLPISLNTDFIATILGEFQEKSPEIDLDIYEAGSYSIEQKMEEHLLDIAFALKPVSVEKFLFIPVSSDHLSLLVSQENPLARKSSVEFKDLEYEKFIMLSSSYKTRQLTVDCCVQAGYAPTIVFSTSQVELIVEMVARNKGIAILPEVNTKKAAGTSNKIVSIPINDAAVKIEMGFIIDKSRSSNYITNALFHYMMNTIENVKPRREVAIEIL